MNIGSGKMAGLAVVIGTIFTVSVHSPAQADNDKLSGFPAMVLSGETATATVVQFSVPFDNLISLADKDVSLGKTSLEEIQSVAGGTVHSHTVSSVETAWLCYEIKGDNLPRRIWFISDGLNKRKDQGAVLNLISAEFATDKAVKCDQPRIDLTSLKLPIPALKDDKRALEERLGKVKAKQFARYANERKVSGATVEQSLVYRLDGDRITGVAFSQATAK
ncbi:hypothetical protein F9K91_22805 [Brucella tritici]|uniref:Uncharacterized protein n=1 Tax=Brucella tritici TaxID=94626 RepID=A0A7X6FU50_9HYPH|nr:hypothetical protein [Brucella tritici]KAB2662322.1 hypothetical protein F9K91_22805 [Brucella tritici]NKW10659.1 hypothetical protein [Brucella tritici]